MNRSIILLLSVIWVLTHFVSMYTLKALPTKELSVVKEQGPIGAFTKDGTLGAFRPSLGPTNPVLVDLATGKTRFTLEEKRTTQELFIKSIMAFNSKRHRSKERSL